MEKRKSRIQKDEADWDRRKIIFFIVLVIVLLIFGFYVKNLILGNSVNTQLIQKNNRIAPAQGLKKGVQDKINDLRDEASNINLVDIATSSPQVQKVINDLKTLKDYPNNQLKQTCINMCSKL